MRDGVINLDPTPPNTPISQLAGGLALATPSNLHPHYPTLNEDSARGNEDEAISKIQPAEFTPNNKRRRANLSIPLSSADDKDEPDIQELPDRNPAPGTERLDYIPRYVAPSGTSQTMNFEYNGTELEQTERADR